MAEGGNQTHSCSIFGDDFTYPKTLLCPHTFCKDRIDDYTKPLLPPLDNCRTTIWVLDGRESGHTIQPKSEKQNHFGTGYMTIENVISMILLLLLAVAVVYWLVELRPKTEPTEEHEEFRGKLHYY
ncbi:hypothetical protein SNE40_022335 [Patella caerulea]|uniref:Uncharacterized protein n=1 Tax=Patella caerulea TaxID=87958 RepID=A0AAN8FWG5_PATCE